MSAKQFIFRSPHAGSTFAAADGSSHVFTRSKDGNYGEMVVSEDDPTLLNSLRATVKSSGGMVQEVGEVGQNKLAESKPVPAIQAQKAAAASVLPPPPTVPVAPTAAAPTPPKPFGGSPTPKDAHHNPPSSVHGSADGSLSVPGGTENTKPENQQNNPVPGHEFKHPGHTAGGVRTGMQTGPKK